MSDWNSSRWQKSQLKLQMPIYDDIEKLSSIKKELKDFDGLVDLDKILLLKKKLKSLEKNKGFLIIGGNCAETLNFDNDTADTVRTIQEMASIISKKTGGEVIKIGRMAGQYAKPRSNEFETIDGTTLPIYRGDIINNINFTEESRKPNPELMIKAFNKSSETLKTIEKIDGNFFTTHEALLLDYEESLVREKDDIIYLSSTHFPWIGDRTRNSNSAHVEFLRGIVNPISIKCGINTDLDDLVKIIKLLNPENEAGKISLTVRMGNKNIEKYFPILIKHILKNNLNVLWISDPMHGNGKKTYGPLPYRTYVNLIGKSFLEITKANELSAKFQILLQNKPCAMGACSQSQACRQGEVCRRSGARYKENTSFFNLFDLRQRISIRLLIKNLNKTRLFCINCFLQKSSVRKRSGRKTRYLEDIEGEISKFFSICKNNSIYPSGVHLEMTGNDVTECIGLSVNKNNLNQNYKTLCDPRLNREQSLYLIKKISELI